LKEKDQEDELPGLQEELEKVWDELEKRRNAPYDGIIGSIHDYMPTPLIREFESTSNYLLREYPHQKLMKYFQGRKNFFQPGRFWTPNIPVQIIPYLDSLIYIEQLVNLGEESGREEVYKAYLGEGGYEVYRGIVTTEVSSKGGKNRANKLSPLHSTIKTLKLQTFTDILEIFKDEEKMTELYKSNQIDINIEDIDHEKGIIFYAKRSKAGSSENMIPADVTFQTLKNKYPQRNKKNE